MKRVFLGVGLGLAVYAGGQLGYWVQDDVAPTTILRAEVIPLKPYPGGEVHIRYFIRRYRSCNTRVERTLYDAKQLRIPLPERSFSASPGPVGDDSYVVSVPLMASISPGPATYRIITTYICNPFHNIWPIVVTSPDVHFTIREAP